MSYKWALYFGWQWCSRRVCWSKSHHGLSPCQRGGPENCKYIVPIQPIYQFWLTHVWFWGFDLCNYLNVLRIAIRSQNIVVLYRCALFQPLLMVQIQPALKWQAWRFSLSMLIKMGLLICVIYVQWLVLYMYTIFLILIVICCIFLPPSIFSPMKTMKLIMRDMQLQLSITINVLLKWYSFMRFKTLWMQSI